MAQFARNTSGLRREFRAIDVFVFNVLAYAIGVSLVITPPLLGGLYPKANLLLVMGLGLILATCNGLTYGLFGGAMPRSGGDYIFISRSLSPWLGFTASFGFVVSQVIGIGLYAGQCTRDALGAAFVVLGSVSNHPSLVTIGTALGEPVWNIAVGILLLVTVYAISVRGMRALKYFLRSFFVVALGGTAAMAFVLAGTTHGEFVARLNQFLAATVGLPNAYETILRAGAQAGATSAGGTLWDSVMALPIGYLAFVGFTYSVYIGGEVRTPERSQVRGILAALFLGCLVFFGVLGWYYYIAGQDFVNALPVWNAAGSKPIPLGGSLVLQAALLTDDGLLQVLICLGFFLWFFLLLFVMSQACVRIVFAWAMDRLAFSSLTKVDPDTASLYVATRVVLLLSLAGLVVNASGAAFINYIALFSVCFFFAGIAAVVFPFRHRSLFERAPALVRYRVAGKWPLLTIAGAGNCLLFFLLLYSAFSNPGLSGVSGWIPRVFIVGVYVAGFVWYVTASRRTGVDPAVLYEELPPDVEEDLTDNPNGG